MDFLTLDEIAEFKNSCTGKHITMMDWYEKRIKEPLDYEIVRYYYKKETKYPRRVYVLMGNWNDRNLRPMGIMGQFPFIERVMTRDEAVDNHFSTRMKYYQYETWFDLVEADKAVGVPEEFIKRLEEYTGRYPLADKEGQLRIF